jgi:hypothetical protein
MDMRWMVLVCAVAAACGPGRGSAEGEGEGEGGSDEGDELVGDDDDPCTPSAARELLAVDDDIGSAVIVDDAVVVAVGGSIVRIESDGSTRELVADVEVHEAGLAVTDDALVWHVHGEAARDDHPPSVMWRAPRDGGAPTMMRDAMPSIDIIGADGDDVWWVRLAPWLEPTRLERWRAGAADPEVFGDAGGNGRSLRFYDDLVVATFGSWDPPTDGWARAWERDGTPVELPETELMENNRIEDVALGSQRVFASDSTNVKLEAVPRTGGPTEVVFELGPEPTLCDAAGRLRQLETVDDDPWWLLEDGKVLRESNGTVEVVHDSDEADPPARWFGITDSTLFVVESHYEEPGARVLAIDLD